MEYPYYDIVRRDVLRMIPQDGKVIGSIGCGYGATEAELVKQGREVHGVDTASEAVERARGRLTSARLVSAEEDPFEAASLDGLILADVLEHVPLAWEALKRWTVGVKRGGWVAISVPNMRNLKVFWHLGIRGDWPETATGVFDRTHLQVMTRRRLLRWCSEAGLEPERWYDAYLSANTKKEPVLRWVDRLTCRYFHDWVSVQWQVVCRKM